MNVLARGILSIVVAAAGCGTGNGGPARAAQIVVEQGGAGSQASAVFGGNVFGNPIASAGACTALLGSSGGSTFQAGELDFTGTILPFSLQPEGNDPRVTYLQGTTLPQPVFTAGQTITVTAAGGSGPDDLPPFVETVVGPDPVAGHVPPAMLSRSGATVTWTAGTSTKMWVMMVALDGMQQRIVICITDDTGSFDIPPPAFTLLPQTTTVILGLARVDGTLETVRDAEVQLAAMELLFDNPIPLGP